MEDVAEKPDEKTPEGSGDASATRRSLRRIEFFLLLILFLVPLALLVRFFSLEYIFYSLEALLWMALVAFVVSAVGYLMVRQWHRKLSLDLHRISIGIWKDGLQEIALKIKSRELEDIVPIVSDLIDRMGEKASLWVGSYFVYLRTRHIFALVFVGIGAILGEALFVRQIELSRSHLEEIRNQNSLLRIQFRGTVRNDLLEVLFDEDKEGDPAFPRVIPDFCDASDLPTGPSPAASSRLRGEALRALVDLEKVIADEGTLADEPETTGTAKTALTAKTGLRGVGALLSGTDMVGLSLVRADLRSARLELADVSYAMLAGARLEKAEMACVKLTGVDLRGATLNLAHLPHARMGGSDLTDTHLTGADLRGVDLSAAQGERTRFVGSDLSGATLDQARFPSSVFVRSRLDNVVATGASFDGRSVFTGASMENGQFALASMIEADLRGASLRGSSFWKVNLSKSKLQGSNWQSVNLSGANLVGCRDSDKEGSLSADFSAAILERTLVYGVDLSRATGLEQDQLNRTCGDSETTIAGLDRPDHWHDFPVQMPVGPDPPGCPPDPEP